LVGIQDLKSRYRSVDPRALPKFGSEKKIYSEVARESGESGAKSSGEVSKGNMNAAADKNVRAPSVGAAVGEKSITAPIGGRHVGVTGGAEKAPQKAARQDRSSGWVSELGSKLSSLVSQKPKPTRGAIPRFNGVPVQGELSLDNIKVVRNDLSDADLEVVARKAIKPEPEEPEAGQASSPAAEERPDLKVRRLAGTLARPGKWERVTTMFSAVKS